MQRPIALSLFIALLALFALHQTARPAAVPAAPVPEAAPGDPLAEQAASLIARNFPTRSGRLLAAALMHAERHARPSAHPMPEHIHRRFRDAYDPSFLNAVRWTTLDHAGITLDGLVFHGSERVVAVTLGDVIVFRSDADAENLHLWAHELVHVEQIRRLGIQSFARAYAEDGGGALEAEATARSAVLPIAR